MFVPTPLIFASDGFSAVSDLDIYLRTPFLRVRLRLNVSNVIRGGSDVVIGSFQSFPRDLGWFLSNILGYLCSFLVAVYSTVWPLVWWRFFLSLDPQTSQFSRVSKTLGGTALFLWAVSLEIFSQPSVIVIPWLRRYWRVACLLLNGVFRLFIFPCFLLVGEDKIEVIEEFVSSVLRVFYYRLAFLRSGFAKCRTR